LTKERKLSTYLLLHSRYVISGYDFRDPPACLPISIHILRRIATYSKLLPNSFHNAVSVIPYINNVIPPLATILPRPNIDYRNLEIACLSVFTARTDQGRTDSGMSAHWRKTGVIAKLRTLK